MEKGGLAGRSENEVCVALRDGGLMFSPPRAQHITSHRAFIPAFFRQIPPPALGLSNRRIARDYPTPAPDRVDY